MGDGRVCVRACGVQGRELSMSKPAPSATRHGVGREAVRAKFGHFWTIKPHSFDHGRPVVTCLPGQTGHPEQLERTMACDWSDVLTAATAVSDRLDTDIYVVSAPMERDVVEQLIQQHARATGRTNGALVLTTYGGDPDAAYLLARFIKRTYDCFTLYVFGPCKSAGTLIALGADEIVMSVRGEMGPLDVQLIRDDDLFRHSSGLDIFQALSILNVHVFNAFESHFLNIIRRGGGAVTTRTAAEIATNLAVQLFTPITAQIDPMRLGEMQRAVDIAQRYGELLGGSSEAVRRLIVGYPSHSFAIDYDEAKEIFAAVRVPEEDELLLESLLAQFLSEHTGSNMLRLQHEHGICACLTPNVAIEENEHATASFPSDPGTAEANGAGADAPTAAAAGRADSEITRKAVASNGSGREAVVSPADQ